MYRTTVPAVGVVARLYRAAYETPSQAPDGLVDIMKIMMISKAMIFYDNKRAVMWEIYTIFP